MLTPKDLFDQYLFLLSEFAVVGPSGLMLDQHGDADRSLQMYRLQREYEATKRVHPELYIETLESRRPLTSRDRTYLDAAAKVNGYIDSVLRERGDGPPDMPVARFVEEEVDID